MDITNMSSTGDVNREDSQQSIFSTEVADKPSSSGELSMPGMETPAQSLTSQNQPSAPVFKFRRTRYDKLPEEVKGPIRQIEQGLLALYKAFLDCTDQEKIAFFGLDNRDGIVRAMLRTFEVAYFGPQNQIDQTPSVSASSDNTASPPEYPPNSPEHNRRIGILLQELNEASPLPGFDTFYSIAARMVTLDITLEYNNETQFTEQVSRAWEVIKDIDMSSYLKRLDSSLAELEENHAGVDSYWHIDNPAELLSRIQQNTIEPPDVTALKHGMLRHLRECCDVEQLYKAAAILQSKNSSATHMSYQYFKGVWGTVYQMQHPGKPLLQDTPGQTVKFTKRHWEEALRQGQNWNSWFRMFSPGVLLLFLVAQYKDEGFVQNEGDWTISWGLDISIDQINWIGIYIDSYLPKFTAAANFLAPWTRVLYEKGWVSREERREIIEGLRNLGFGEA